MPVVLSKLSPLYCKTKSLKTDDLLLLIAAYYFLQTNSLWFLQSSLTDLYCTVPCIPSHLESLSSLGSCDTYYW